MREAIKYTILMLMLIYGNSLFAGINEANQAFDNGLYTNAYKEYKKLADQGNADAQFRLGQMYNNGKGLPKNNEKAVTWYRKAAKNGHVTAQSKLGAAYLLGQGVKQDNREAILWLHKAAVNGDTDAQFNLATMYFKGEGTQQDYNKAFKWFHSAAEKGSADAQFGLGFAYYLGEGIEQNYDSAIAWSNKAAYQGHLGAIKLTALMHYYGEGTSQSYSKAFNWYKKAANQEDSFSQNKVGEMYRDGQGTPKDYGAAMSYFKKSATNGNSDAQLNIGLLYFSGLGVEQNESEAVKWFKRSAEQENPRAQYVLGLAYANGTGIHYDYNRAEHLLIKAEENGMEGATEQRKLLTERRNAREAKTNQMFAEEIAAGRFEPDGMVEYAEGHYGTELGAMLAQRNSTYRNRNTQAEQVHQYKTYSKSYSKKLERQSQSSTSRDINVPTVSSEKQRTSSMIDRANPMTRYGGKKSSQTEKEDLEIGIGVSSTGRAFPVVPTKDPNVGIDATTGQPVILIPK